MTRREATPEECEAALALIAVIEAQSKGDQLAANVILDPWRDNLAPVLQFATSLLGLLIPQAVDDPSAFLGALRIDLINGMAKP